MACARHVGFHNMPIVCVNVDGYYDTFMSILQRAHSDKLLYKEPQDIVHFEETPEAAVKWIEDYLADPRNKEKQQKTIKTRTSVLKRLQSNVSGSAFAGFQRMVSFFGDEGLQRDGDDVFESTAETVSTVSLWRNNAVVFTAGLSLGFLLANRMRSK